MPLTVVPSPRHLGEHALQPGQSLLPLLGAQADLDAVDRVEHRARRARLMSISEISSASGLPLRSSARMSAIAARARGDGAVRIAASSVLAEPADHRRRRGDRPRDLAEQVAVLVEPVQPARRARA